MSTRLLAFLSDIEHSLAADEPSPNGGSWSNSRSISYHMGLARLTLASTGETGRTPMGEVLLHSSNLADGSICFKATLQWHGSAASSVESIYEKPNIEWRSCARRVAAIWLGGAPVLAETVTLVEEPIALQAVG